MKYVWLNDITREFLSRWYIPEGETVENKLEEIANTAERLLDMPGYWDRFLEYMSKWYYSLASPVWSNFWNDRWLPISCFTSYVKDDMANILHTQWEVWMMSKYGGGTAWYFGDLRPRGSTINGNGKSSGAVHFMQLFDKNIDVVSQGSVRRWAFAAYYPLEWDDIMEFLDVKTEWNPIQLINTWVTVGDKFLEDMVNGNEKNRKIWAKVIQSRSEIWQPYIFFTDNVNNNTVDCYKDKWHKIHSSNLCSEIALPTSEDWSFVCCLSSMNILHYDEWKNTDAVEVLVYFLEAVMTDFILKLEAMRDSTNKEKNLAFKFMERAYNFAVDNRALGLWVIGWHSYLQARMIPFESPEARDLNKTIHKDIQEKSYKASAELAEIFGEPSVCVWYWRRHATLNAIAPTTSSAFILGQVSQSIEPIWSNYYVKDLAKTKFTYKNPYLKELLASKWLDTKDVWNSIRDNDGSVQHLDELTSKEKKVFKTFVEMSQYEIIDQAADRQKFIDQAQSINLMINPTTPTKEINALYLDAWRQGIKTLYYQHSKSAAQELSRKIQCSWCEA